MTIATAREVRTVRLGRTTYPVIGPSLADPRLRVAAVIVSIQLLGQVVLGFEISIAQILIALATAIVIEVGVTMARSKVIAWPGSALLTANGCALILRVPGTQHGDWWSTKGAWIFSGTVAVSLLSKYLIRWRGTHVFNPSNFGLVLCFLALGSRRVAPLDFWWGPLSPGLLLAYAVIGIGGVTLARRLGFLDSALVFWWTFAASLAVVAASGHAMEARWHVGPITGTSFWIALVTSPEVFIFLFFMITDPRTAPRGQVARAVYAGAIGVLAALFVAPQRTEYAAKVGVLGALVVVCVFAPWLSRRLPQPGDEDDSIGVWLRARLSRPRRPLGIAIFVVGALVLASLLNSVQDPLRSRVGSVARPSIAVDDPAIPTVRFVPSNEVASSIDTKVARRMARDLVVDLRLQDEALRQHDTDLAAAASFGRWLAVLRRDIARSTDSGSTTVRTYDIDTMVVSLARRPGQGNPAILASLTGTQRRITYEGTTFVRVVDHGTSALSKTFEIAWDGHHYLITSDIVPPGWAPPRP